MSFMDTMNSKETKTNKTNSTTTSYTLGSSSTNGSRYGWICPVCGRGNSPDNSYCNCRGYMYYPTWPTYPWWTQPWYCTTTTSPNVTINTDGNISTAKNTTLPHSYTTTATTVNGTQTAFKTTDSLKDIAYINGGLNE